MEHIIDPATADDAFAISYQLRQEDYEEIQAATGQHPADVLPWYVDEGDTMIWRYGVHYAAIFGISKINEQTGAPWLVVTPELVKHPFFFVRTANHFFDEWGKRFPRLVNCVDARNELHIKWLKWCGFAFTHLHREWGAAKLPFWQFERLT